ncbi:hypothetical protein BH11PSE8_BH11PSE8_19420 [soil metagenome]
MEPSIVAAEGITLSGMFQSGPSAAGSKPASASEASIGRPRIRSPSRVGACKVQFSARGERASTFFMKKREKPLG